MNGIHVSKTALGTAGGILTVGAAVLGGRAWGQSAGSGASGSALAAGPVVGAGSGANWVTQVAQSVRTSIVSIDVSGQAQSRGRFGGSQQQGGTGSGVLLDNQGDILTNYHVVTLDGSTTSASIQVGLANGKTDSAQVVGEDASTDLAVIRVPAGDVSGLTPIQWADPSSIVVGEPVVAIGYALDLGGEPTVTSGVVSAVNREIDEQSTTISGAVQTDAAVNPGNSGGPLLDSSGQVIGINTAGLVGTASQPAQGINFAISVQTAQSVAQSLIQNGSVNRGYLGVSVSSVTPQDAQSGTGSTAQGALVQQVASGSPADKAGLQTGDVIVKVGDVTVTNTGDLTTAMTRYGPGTSVSVTYERGGTQHTTTVALSQRSNG